ncbi:MAG: hypothetical protein J2O44_02700 [Porphyrobacter sp.]|nr:hypothetical protein [Porphyrobacter sp.]
MTKKFLFAAPLLLAAGSVLATPASATPWNNGNQIRAEIAQLDRQIDRTRGLSQREQQQLHREVSRVQALYRSYARGGFTRSELQTLDRAVGAVKADIARQSHDANGHKHR